MVGADQYETLPVPRIPIVFIDLDETLVSTDTDGLWARFIMRKNPLEFWGMWKFYSLYRLYRTGRLQGKDLAEFQAFRVRKYRVSEFRALAEEFFQTRGRIHIFPEAVARVRAHAKASSTIVLITAQHECVAEPFARHMGMELIANRIETRDDRFTGRHVLPYCFREGKLELAAGFAAERGLSLKECGMYSDSINDLFMLENTGYPFAVNPDRELEKIAIEKNWPILRWTHSRPG